VFTKGLGLVYAGVGGPLWVWYSHGRLLPELAVAVDADTVRRVAHLARIAVADDEVEPLRGELNAMLAFVEQLMEVDVAAVEAMTSVVPMAMKMRDDKVTDGGIADAVTANAPALEDHFFLVPKVVE
jgi:aspartyl-tRNA(Asn)/glutamyl-tRNA(Gln) amidotransferase subunit C